MVSVSVVLGILGFAPICPKDDKRARSAGSKADSHIQSQSAKSMGKFDWVQECSPGQRAIRFYDTGGPPYRKGRHGVGAKNGEGALLKSGHGVAIAPTLIFPEVGTLRRQRLLRGGLRIGLGKGSLVSKTLSTMTEGYESITLKEAFRFATLGGAKVVRMEDRIGNFEVGKEIDALLVDTEATGTPLDIFLEDKTEEKIEKFLYNGDDRNVLRVYVAGKESWSTDVLLISLNAGYIRVGFRQVLKHRSGFCATANNLGD
ncbi:guanine deaminase-like [Penaeus monodon]|uniref:guanine deaminase-like n=1 Tax=Penaeus monodon TaxID=6687 RepID=UPI0018A7CDCA|nr:guanine deaminase-like [Penaeus monodon]